MTRFEALAITAPFFAVVVMGLLFLLVTKSFDNRAAEKQNKQKQAELARQTGSALASAAVEESSRGARRTAVAHRVAASEQRQPW